LQDPIPSVTTRLADTVVRVERGVFGAIFIGLGILLIPQLGAATCSSPVRWSGRSRSTTSVCSVFPVHPVSAARIAGAALLVGGAVLVGWSNANEPPDVSTDRGRRTGP
jgi:bacterial/archaeal transporter family-2 protein